MLLEMTMKEEMGTALREEAVIFHLIKEEMVVDDHQVHITGIEIALTMGMDPSQTLDLNLGEVQTMAERKAQQLRNTKGMDPSQTRDLNLGEVQSMEEGKAQPMRDTKVVLVHLHPDLVHLHHEKDHVHKTPRRVPRKRL